MSRFMIFLSLFLLCLFRNVCSSCEFENGKYDLSTLDRATGWPVSGATINGTQFHYEISLCRPLNHSACPRSSVCLISDNNSAISYGNAIENISDYAIAANFDNGFALYVLTNTLCQNRGRYRAAINFRCGPHLGVPELMVKNDCQVIFSWRTSAACLDKPKIQQVPCYALDDKGNVRNLSPLIKNDGYFVSTRNPAVDFIINVCANLSRNSTQNNCTQNAMACRVNGVKYQSFGSESEGLKYTSEGLILTYKTPDNLPIPSDCRMKPKTTIFFKCPVRGYNQPPKLISDSNCQYEVEWETEYACPENMLKGNLKTCQFTPESHGVAIDLSPLSKKMYNVTNSTSSSSFTLSVCSGLENFNCGGTSWKSTTVCYVNSSGLPEIAGSIHKGQLLYADGEVSLKYVGGSCNGSEFTSVINFICDLNAENDGDGKPVHVSTYDCTHLFAWHTKHACFKHPLDTPCSVTYNKKTVNLQKLLLLDGDPWEAIDTRPSKTANQSEFFINVCGQISRLGNYGKCGEDSSACAFNYKTKEYINLGNFNSPPVYDPLSESIQLHYTGGSLCSQNKVWHSTINFKCKPGRMNSKPILTRIDEKECHYEFEWLTADACPTGIIEGSDCKVIDSNLGLKYDLTPLKSKIYNVHSPSYEFYLSVCEPVAESPCTDSKNSTKNVGVCQVDTKSNHAWKAGEPTSKLSYMDGVVNLTYLSGDPYDDQKKTNRVSIIIFICDYEAGNGRPHFIEEEDFALVFHWYTDLVCPLYISSDCMVLEPFSNFIYDLSGLSATKKNWMTIFNEEDKERRIILNVCRPLVAPMPNGCDPKAAACLVEHDKSGKEKVIVSNLGHSVSSPVLESLGHLTLTYTGGDPCVSFGENTTYSTVINFLCVDEDTIQTSLKLLSKIGACEYSLLWASKAACPSPDELKSVGSCQLTDPDSGFTFDLMPLFKEKEPYSVVSTSGRTFQLNICGKVNEGCFQSDGSKENISVCEIGKGNATSNIAVSDSYILKYSKTDLTLIYRSFVGVSKEVIIKFPCYNSTTTADPKLVHYEDDQYVFEMKTPLACIPEPIECNVVDYFGREYDFSPLARYSGGNWEVSDIRPELSHLKYHINFCRPLNKDTNYKCPGGASSACQTDINNKDGLGYDLGSQMIEPIIGGNGAVILHYTGGSPCNNGQSERSTVITLYCSSEESELRFLGESPECEYAFSMDTPVACPLESYQGDYCRVKDEIFGYAFNLNPLKNKNSNYNVTVGEYTYVFNVCDKLNGFNDSKCSNSSACQLKSADTQFSKSLGLPSEKLVYRKGLITLEYKYGSGNCHGKYNRTTKITFVCHHAREDKDGPIFIGEAFDCSYLFEWPTVHACPPFEVIECSVSDDKGVNYDLSRLSLPNENYYVKHPMFEKTFVINVCRSVVHTPYSLCPYSSAACLIDNDSKIEALNLGEAYHEPYFENGKLKINYTSGDPCEEEMLSARFMQTVIEFTCDPSLIDSKPEFIGQDDCTYYFDWHTAYACPPKQVENDGECIVEDPITGHIFNFSSLENKGFFNITTQDHRFFLNICGSGRSSPCGDSAGMCQEEISGDKRHWSGGILNKNLTYNSGMLLLNYSDGDFCHNNQFKRNTLIELHCGRKINEPQFLFESHDCTYYFDWETSLACQTLMHCAVKNGSLFYDFTPLSESYHTAATSILNDSASYYISVCSPLEGIAGCPPDAAVCRVSWDMKTSKTIAESLGKVELPPFIDFGDSATSIYTGGSVCSKNPKHFNRARIIFVCSSNAGMGEPVLINVSDDCLFIFEWRTNIVCPEKPEEPSTFTSCNYTDSSKGIHFDLLPLQKTGTKPYYEVFDGQNVSFKINICSSLHDLNVSNCNDSGVCGKIGNIESNYGVAASQKFSYTGERLRLTFNGGDDCPSGIGGKKGSEIMFACDPSAGLGEPKLFKRYNCLVVFIWKTSLVCLNMQRQCAFYIDGKHYDFNLLTSLSHNWISTDSRDNTYWINICRGIQPTSDTLGCSPTSAVCMLDSSGYHMSLGMVHTMKIESEKNSSGLILTFENGDARACSFINSTLRPVSRLFMRCGRSLGHPRMFSGPDKQCYYDFEWESSLACPDIVEEVMIEKDGIIKDKRLDFSFDINDILNRTFVVPGNNTDDHYVYKINLSGGVANNKFDAMSTCAKAAICQTKDNFERDIGSFETKTFVVRGSELHLVFKSLTRHCGKNPSKEVTSLINMQCSSAAGIGSPEFLYESGNCDYIFEWPTVVVCPDYHRKSGGDPNASGGDPNANPHKDVQPASHSAEITIGVIFSILAVMIIVFIVIKPERRALVSFRIRSMFGRVNLPYFRYKRSEGERLVLVDASQTTYDDDEILRC